MNLVWYRNDLRIHAHRALKEALQAEGPVTAVYFLCDQQWDEHGVAPLRRWYVLHSLIELGEQLAARGITLHVQDAGDFSRIPAMLQDFTQQQGISQVFCSREYPLNERRRDKAVAKALDDAGVSIRGFDDSVLVPPATLRTGKGTPYTVFSAYKKRWDVWLDSHFQQPELPGKASAKPVAFADRAVVESALESVSVAESLTAHWQPGEQAAATQLEHFVARHLGQYRKLRDFPSLTATSGLSAALSAGTLSPASCYLAARQAMADAGARDGAACWIGELAWRDFYRQIMAQYPRLSWGRAFRPETDLLKWDSDDALFQAWCEGRTGYPLVDAAMRQLVATGWMHNRLRMVTAMFLSKHLWQDWRKGEAFFMAHLIDGDFAANNGGWQWSASTGTDAVPYFRVFNPIRQSQRFDAEGHFIARWVPELKALDNKTIHEPWKQPLLVPDYPAPVVSHAGVRERVTQAFKAVKKDYDDNHAQGGN
ncbi:deoxyribodipyrimidine photo-lyase [Alcanivorax sp.]|uniref:cryptochrome/photolyase family protein n=1 Tax=Alcanivorax sp. TaxID=1872427 RepID=UPI0025C0967B|nr:deoxyribodipyrimidine photo-lyase [Alcanivorax sp.]